MAPRKGSRSLRFGNVNNHDATSPTTPNAGVTREELYVVVAGLHQQMENQNNAILEKLTALLAAQANPSVRRVEINVEGNAHSSALDHHEDDEALHDEGIAGLNGNHVSDNENHLNAERSNLNAHGQHQHSNHPQGRHIPQREGGTTEGAPLHAGGSRPQSTIHDRLFRQTSGEVTGIRPVGPSNDEEYISRMIRQIMKESQQREEDEKDWGFAPSKTPFTERILKAEFPKKFTPPTIPAFRGNSDPNEFLYKYDWHMSGARATDEIKCRYFPVYLESVALLWFTKLPVRSVDQFSDLTQKFKDQFRLYA